MLCSLKAVSFQFWKTQHNIAARFYGRGRLSGVRTLGGSVRLWMTFRRGPTAVVGLGILWLLLAGCGSTVQHTLPPPTPTVIATQAWPELFGQHATAEAAVTALILAERQAAIDHDLALLGQLWAEDAQIIDGRNTTTPIDDYRWQGRAAILDRYVVAVFPFNLPPLPNLEPTAVITITGQQAVVQNGNDHWQLVKANDRWWLTELRYSTP